MTVNTNATKADWIDPDDAPELDDDWFDRAALMHGDTVIRPGRPPLARNGGSTKRLVSLRLDEAVIAAFRATGPGWQTRLNAALRKAVGI
ncbi:MAG: BrnA antitoxin family protein [Sandarakinorhabdus sp.]|nr:BrnA antitoxin family protein [Sandarakinorhabdus sp.]